MHSQKKKSFNLSNQFSIYSDKICKQPAEGCESPPGDLLKLRKVLNTGKPLVKYSYRIPVVELLETNITRADSAVNLVLRIN